MVAVRRGRGLLGGDNVATYRRDPSWVPEYLARCHATANEIEQTGQAAVEIAAEIMKEAQQLAAVLRANGKKMSEHLQEFAVVAKKVSTAMRDTRSGVLNPSENMPKN